MLIDQIQLDLLEARKARETRKSNLLTTLVGEATLPGLNDGHRKSTDQEVIKVVKRFIDGVTASLLALRTGNAADERIAALESELVVLGAYMPKMLTDEELQSTIRSYIGECKQNGVEVKLANVMSFLRTNCGGTYDGLVAKNIAVSLL